MFYLSEHMFTLHLCLFLLAVRGYLCSEINSFEIRNNVTVDFEDANLNITQLVTKYGYDIEEYSVITEDGYILTLHRILPKIKALKKAVFLMPGILDSSDGWILQGRNSLGYLLADEGYDVWLGNARGNKYSLLHTSLVPNSSDYWKFSWDEIGFYDLPKMIDHTLKVTGLKQLYYIGHSQGNTAFYVMTSLHPEYNEKIEIMFSLSPVAFMSNAKSPALKLFTTYGIFNYATSNSYVDYYNNISGFICKYFETACDTLIQQIIGRDYNLTDSSFLKIIFSHLSSISIRQFIHYGQLYKSGRFCRYDYGLLENLIKYKNISPPDYDLSKINVRIELFYSDNDWLCDTEDVRKLYNALPNVINTYKLQKFNHLDFMYAKAAKDLIYKKIIQQIEENESNK